MARFLGVECPNCDTLFAIAQLVGDVKAAQPDPMLLRDVDCPGCGRHFSQFTGEVVEFDAEQAPSSGGREVKS
jgi:ribosomal protein S27E